MILYFSKISIILIVYIAFFKTFFSTFCIFPTVLPAILYQHIICTISFESFLWIPYDLIFTGKNWYY